MVCRTVKSHGRRSTPRSTFHTSASHKSPWFTQVLLYRDKAASIVPEGLEHEQDGLDPYMRDLPNLHARARRQDGQPLVLRTSW